MLNTKLILVDGMTGSGKSTTAHFIARQLEKNGIKVKCYFEQAPDHPMYYKWDMRECTSQEFIDELIEEYPKQWASFAEKVKNDDCVYIVEGIFFQFALLRPIKRDKPYEVIKNYSLKMGAALKPLNPTLIHFYQNDVNRTLDDIWEQRGAFWTKHFLADYESYDYAENRNLKGKYASYAVWRFFNDLTLDIFKELDCHKIQFENSERQWDLYKKQIIDFLGINLFPEIAYLPEFERFCGIYQNETRSHKIHILNNRLCVDLSITNIKLLPKSESEFLLEAYSGSIKFITDDDGSIKSLQTIKTPRGLCTEGEFIRVLV